MLVNSTIREAVDSLREDYQVDVTTMDGLREAMGDSALWNQYVTALSEGVQNASLQEQFAQFAENTRMTLMAESALTNLSPISALTMPMLRKAWPATAIKEALPTEVAKVPKFTVPHLIPYLVDPDTGSKEELPEAMAAGQALKHSQKRVDTAPKALPLDATDVMPAGCPVSGGYALDPVFGIAKAVVTVTDDAGANPEDVEVRVLNGKADSRTGAIHFTVKAEHSAGHVTSDTAFGVVDFEAGTLTLTSLSSAASATRAKIKSVVVNGKIDSSNHKRSTEIGFRNRVEEITIGTGEHVHANLPTEWLQDNMAIYNLDGTLKVVDIITNVFNQRVDMEGVEFLEDSADYGKQTGHTIETSFNVHPTGNFSGSPTEWLVELRRVVDNVANRLKNKRFYSKGYFVIFGNPVDTALLPNVEWTYNANSGDDLEGVDGVDYSYGWMSGGAARYKVVSGQNVPEGKLHLFFVPQVEDQRVYVYYPYSYNVENSASGYRNPNSNVPGVVVSKRHTMKRFNPMHAEISIQNNDGTIPAAV